MAWEKLAERLRSNTLPPVLAGPILRKVTTSLVTVWLALKESADVTLTIFDSNGVSALLSDKRKTVRIGKFLHIVAVTVRSSGEFFKPGKVYYYDVSFSTATGPKNLRDRTATTGSLVWGYDAHRLPSFAISPAELGNVRLIQGSCRKTIATGGDA